MMKRPQTGLGKKGWFYLLPLPNRSIKYLTTGIRIITIATTTIIDIRVKVVFWVSDAIFQFSI